MKLIQTVTVGSGGTGQVQFASIPQTYTDLMIKVSGRLSVDTINFYIYFNGYITNSTSKQLYGTGSSAASSAGSGSDYVYGSVSASSYTANTFGNCEIYFPNYTSNLAKSFAVDAVSENNGTTAYMSVATGLWNPSTQVPISTITLSSYSTHVFTQYSTVSLYGITKGSGGATAA